MTKMQQEIMESVEAVRRCGDSNKPVIAELVKALNKKKPAAVVLAARGTSDHAATFGKYLMEIYKGIPCALAAPSVYTLYDGMLNLKNCLVIGISQSGEAADVLEVIKAGNKAGAITVGITNNADSPLAHTAAWHLDCCAGPEISVAATKTFTTQLYIMTALTAAWSKNKELSADLRRLPVLLQKTLQTEKQIGGIAIRYRFMNECFVLARGIHYPIAEEIALKIKETTYAKAQAYAISDFQHGPIAMVTENAPVIIIDADNKSAADINTILEKLREKKADITMITNRPGPDERANVVIHIPEGAEGVTAAFCGIAAMQLFACNLSVDKGIDPDTPRGLSKITITK